MESSSFKYLREETFQREIMCGILNAQEGDYLLWNIERTITKIYIPILLDCCMGDKGTKDLFIKVREIMNRFWCQKHVFFFLFFFFFELEILKVRIHLRSLHAVMLHVLLK